MAYPSAPPAYSAQNVYKNAPPAYSAQNVYTSPPTVQPPPPEVPEAQGLSGSSTFLGRMVEKITQSKRYQKAASFTSKATKPLREMAIDIGNALKILGKETWKGVSYGALGGLGAGMAITVLCPPLVGPAFTASITAGVTAGGIIGIQIGWDKAVDQFNAARKARRAEVEVEAEAEANFIRQQQSNEFAEAYALP